MVTPSGRVGVPGEVVVDGVDVHRGLAVLTPAEGSVRLQRA